MNPIPDKQIDLKRIEFFITHKCTSHCDHCSVFSKEKNISNETIGLIQAENLITEICSNYQIDSVMTFGGEPMLYPELVCRIHKTAKNCGTPTRQIITNGFWSKNKNRIDEIVSMLVGSDVNELMVSIDCFHEKHLDYDVVKYTVEQLLKMINGSVQLHPVWVRDKNDVNKYNEKTQELLMEFENLNVSITQGNILFPSGRALITLKEYFPEPCMNITGSCKDQPYADIPNEIRSICVEPNGDIVACNTIGNINTQSIADILKQYDYRNDQVLNAMVENGSQGLYKLAKSNGIDLSKDGYYSVCELCKDVSAKMKRVLTRT